MDCSLFRRCEESLLVRCIYIIYIYFICLVPFSFRLHKIIIVSESCVVSLGLFRYNRFTGVTTYDRPGCLSTPVGLTVPPNSWIENKDEQGRLYYGNGKESSWTMPDEYRVWRGRLDAIQNVENKMPAAVPPPPAPASARASASASAPAPAPQRATPANRLLQVFKNERYGLVPPPGKWSLECLLPTDRPQLSDDTGFEGWTCFEEVNDAYDVRDPGWNWEPGSTWVLDQSSRDVDREGWQYSSDFPGKGRAVTHWHGKKLSTHWVRRQRYTRQQVFDQLDYDREFVEFQQKEREKREKAELYKKNPGLAMKDGFKDFQDYCKKQEQKVVDWTKKQALQIQGFPNKVIEDVAGKAIQTYGKCIVFVYVDCLIKRFISAATASDLPYYISRHLVSPRAHQ